MQMPPFTIDRFNPQTSLMWNKTGSGLVTDLSTGKNYSATGLPKDIETLLKVPDLSQNFWNGVSSVSAEIYGTDPTAKQRKDISGCIAKTVKSLAGETMWKYEQEQNILFSYLNRISQDAHYDSRGTTPNPCAKQFPCVDACFFTTEGKWNSRTSVDGCKSTDCYNMSNEEEAAYIDCVRENYGLLQIGLLGAMNGIINELQILRSKYLKDMASYIDQATNSCKACVSCSTTGTSAG